jgi:YD repeat-containing protein
MSWLKLIRSFINAPRFYDKLIAMCLGGMLEARLAAHEITTYVRPRKKKKARKRKPFRLGVETLETRIVPTTQPYVAIDVSEITYFKNSTVLSSSLPGYGGLNPSAWPGGDTPGNTNGLATLFRIYGINSTGLAAGVVYQDGSTTVSYPIASDSYGNYVNLGGPITVPVDIPLSYLNTSLPNTDVPGIALDQETQVVKNIPVPNSYGYPSTIGLMDSVGFQHWNHGATTTYRSFVNVQMTINNNPAGTPGIPGLLTATNKNFEDFEGDGYVNGNPNKDGLRIDDVFSGNNFSASAGSLESGPPTNLVYREQYPLPTNGSQILSTVSTGDDTMWLEFGTISSNSSTALTESSTSTLYGQDVTFTATVSSVAPSTGTPNGTVEFFDGSTPLATKTLSHGVATFVTSTLPVGSNTITATFTSSGGSYGASTSPSVTHLVTAVTLLYGEDPNNALLVPIGEASVDINQGAIRLQQPLDFDQSPGTSVGVDPILTYNSATVDVRPIIPIELSVTSSAVATIQLTLTWNGVAQSPVDFAIPGGYVLGTQLMMAVQDASPVPSTGLYGWSVDVKTLDSSSHVVTDTTTSGYSPIVVRDSSVSGDADPYGAGWGITGIDQLVPMTGGVLWITGAGDSEFFQSNPSGTFTSPPEVFGTLVQNGDGSYTYTDPQQNVSQFNSHGQLLSVTDPDGLALVYTYTDKGALKTVTAPDHGVTTLAYTSNFLKSITEPGGRVINITQSITGGVADLTGIADADGNARTLAYDGNNHVTEDSWSPYVTGFGYDSGTGLLNGVDLGNAMVSNYAVVPAASQGLAAFGTPGQATITDPLTNTTTYLLDGRGRELKEVDALGDTQSWTYTAAGQVASYTDADGHSTGYGYDSSGDETLETDPDGGSTTMGYDPMFHQVTSTAEAIGGGAYITTRNTYDSLGDPTGSTDGNGFTTTDVYNDATDELVSQTDPLGNTTSYAYDADHRLTLVTDPDNGTTETAYDTNGNIATVEDPDGNVTHYNYDANNQLLSQTNPAGDSTASTYTAAGLVSTTTDGLGTVSSTAYDSRAFVTGTTTGSETTTDVNDAAGNVLQSIDPLGNATTNLYDAANRLTETIDPDHNPPSYNRYDPAGNVTASPPRCTTAWTASPPSSIRSAMCPAPATTSRAG